MEDQTLNIVSLQDKHICLPQFMTKKERKKSSEEHRHLRKYLVRITSDAKNKRKPFNSISHPSLMQVHYPPKQPPYPNFQHFIVNIPILPVSNFHPKSQTAKMCSI